MAGKFENSLREIVRQNDLQRVDIGIRLSGKCMATVWWSGYYRDTAPCEHGYGDTLKEALEDALERAKANRVQDVSVDLPDEALS